MSQEKPSSPTPDMPFFDHLEELRKRVLLCLYIFIAGFCLSYFLVNEWVMDFLRQPLFDVLPPDKHQLYFTSLFENFLTHLKIAAVTAIFGLSPFFFYQLWSFVAPGLYPKERKFVIPFIAMGTGFFVGGAAFAYFVLFPAAFKFFIQYGLPTDTPLLTIGAYYGTVLKLLLLFGMAFELPVIVVLLGFLGVIDAAFLRKHRQSSIIGITVLCAMFAPPDAISMLIMMAPLIVLFEMSIWVVQWLGVRRERQRQLIEVESNTKPK